MKSTTTGACRGLARVSLLIAATLLALPVNPAIAQTDGPSMSNVNDVLNGQTLFLPQDDTALLVTTNPVNGNNDTFTQLYPFPTTNSQVTQQSPVEIQNNYGTGSSPSNTVVSAAMGRMFNNGNDVVISITTGWNASTDNPQWSYNYYNPVTKSKQGPYILAADLEPNGSAGFKSRVVMGNFRGTRLSRACSHLAQGFDDEREAEEG